MDITYYDKSEILAALYNNSIVQGLGFLQARPGKMTKEEAQKLLDESTDKYFDYVYGKVLKVDLSKNELRTFLYNRDNGDGAAERVIKQLNEYK